MARPYENLPWGRTQKDSPGAYHDRWLLFGAVLGPDNELAIVRHDRLGLPVALQPQSTVASQTALHLINKDNRAVVPFKITDEGEGSGGDLLRAYTRTSTPATPHFASLSAGGAWTNASSEHVKRELKTLPTEQVTKIIEKLKVYRYEYIAEPGMKYVSPVAEEFHELTGTGNDSTIAPSTLASYALRACQIIWKRIKDMPSKAALTKFEERLTKLELRLNDGETDEV